MERDAVYDTVDNVVLWQGRSKPTRAYNHEDPDVFRLPVNNDHIPYRFEERIGW
jgi:hypothetical protein